MNEEFAVLYRDYSYKNMQLNLSKNKDKLLVDLNNVYQKHLNKMLNSIDDKEKKEITRQYHYEEILKNVKLNEEEILSIMRLKKENVYDYFSFKKANPIEQDKIYRVFELIMFLKKKKLSIEKIIQETDVVSSLTFFDIYEDIMLEKIYNAPKEIKDSLQNRNTKDVNISEISNRPVRNVIKNTKEKK